MEDSTCELHGYPSQEMDGSSVSISDTHTFTSTEEFDALVSRDAMKFRLQYLCNISFPKYNQYRKRRVLSGKGVILVLFLGFLERLAYWGALGNILPAFLEITDLTKANQALVLSVLQNVIAQLLYPIAGYIADVWLGRYKAVHWSLWVLWCGYALLAFSFSFDNSSEPSDSFNRYLLPVCFLIINIGAAGFQANMIPFGADQIIYTASEQLSSYFYWYYWTRNLAGITYALSVSCSNLDPKDRVVIFATLGTASVTLALICNMLLKSWLFIDPERWNPVKTVGKVLYFAARVKRPQIRSAFSVGRKPPPRIDLAKERHGGRFNTEEVEDVKTFLRLLVVLVAIIGALVIYTGITSVAAIQVNHMHQSFLEIDIGSCALSDTAVWVVNVITILMAIPLLNQVIYPCLREYTPSMLKRIGLGYILALSSVVLLMVLDGVGHHQGGLSANETELCMFTSDRDGRNLVINAWWSLLPLTAINLTEVFIFVSCLEFLYAQSPHSMKGMMIGLFFFVQGLSATLASVVLFIFSEEEISEKLNVNSSTQSCGFWYYLVFFIVAMVTLIGYIATSKWYKNRERGDLEESVAFYRDTMIQRRR